LKRGNCERLRWNIGFLLLLQHIYIILDFSGNYERRRYLISGVDIFNDFVIYNDFIIMIDSNAEMRLGLLN